MSENPFIQEEAGLIDITDAGYEFLRDIVTDPYGDVYVFTKNADPVMVAAAMARLSRNPRDLRKTFLKEFAHTKGEEHAEAFFERVLAGYGDDSVAQLLTLPGGCAARYHAAMDSVFSSYSRVVRGVTDYVRQKRKEDDSSDPGLHTAWLGATRAQACDAARPLLPT